MWMRYRDSENPKIDAETLKKQVILHLPYLLFLLVFAKLGEAD